MDSIMDTTPQDFPVANLLMVVAGLLMIFWPWISRRWNHTTLTCSECDTPGLLQRSGALRCPACGCEERLGDAVRR